MNDEEFKRHLYKQMAEDKKNEHVLTHRLYPNKKHKESKDNNIRYQKQKKN